MTIHSIVGSFSSSVCSSSRCRCLHGKDFESESDLALSCKNSPRHPGYRSDSVRRRIRYRLHSSSEIDRREATELLVWLYWLLCGGRNGCENALQRCHAWYHASCCCGRSCCALRSMMCWVHWRLVRRDRRAGCDRGKVGVMDSASANDPDCRR